MLLIDGFKTLKDDVEELKRDMEKTNQENIKEYLSKYEYLELTKILWIIFFILFLNPY